MVELAQTFGPKADESALGYYRRLSAANALWNWKELAHLAQVSPSRTGVLGRPGYTAEVLGLEPAWTASVSRHEDVAREWRGLHRTAHDAVCPDCLKESAHLRASWEHGYAVACPAHGTRLVDRCEACGEMLSTTRERIEQCQCGHDLRQHRTQPATTAQRWLSQLLASDGASSGAMEPRVEGVSTASLSQLVRTLCLFADPEVPNPKRNAAAPRTVQEGVEFLRPLDALLADWPVGFESHVSARIAAGDAQARTLNSLLGRWYLQLKAVSTTGPLQPFLAAVTKVASAEFDGIIGLDAAGGVASDGLSHMLLKQAASYLGVSRDRLLNLIGEGRLPHRTKRFGTRGVVYEIPVAEVERIKVSRAGWVNEAAACEVLAIPPSVLSQMVAARILNADASWRSDGLKAGPIERHSLERLVTVLKSQVRKSHEDGERVALRELTSRRMGDKRAIQAALQAIFEGEVRPVSGAEHVGGLQYLLADVGRHFSTPILEAGLSVNQLSKLTSWKWESISHWMQSGLLESQSIVLRGQPCRVVMPDQLLKFSQSFIPLADLAKALNSKSSVIAERLGSIEVIGAKPLPNGQQRGGLVRMADLARLAIFGEAAHNQGAQHVGGLNRLLTGRTSL